MWVKQCHNHPPVITIFIGGINHPKFVVYDIVLTTFYEFSKEIMTVQPTKNGDVNHP
jgi:hypothetical protein